MLLSFDRGSGWDQLLCAMTILPASFHNQLVGLIFYVLPPLGARCWGRDIVVKMAKQFSWRASRNEWSVVRVSKRKGTCCSGVIVIEVLFSFSLSSMIMLGLLLLHFSSLTISFTRQSLPGHTSTTWLVVWGQDHRKHAHAIYIYTYKRELTTLHD